MTSCKEEFTVIGASGFVGSALVRYLKSLGRSVETYTREADLEATLLSDSRARGNLIYCAGLTADFRSRPFDTVEAHVLLLTRILRSCRFSGLTYLSSSRVYSGAKSTTEDARLQVQSQDPSDLYNLSKLLGESICLHAGKPTKIVRLTNVYGSGEPRTNFLPSILHSARADHKVHFLTSPLSSKDFISLEDVTDLIYRISDSGQQRVYNLGSGKNTSNSELATVLQSLGVETTFASQAKEWSFPLINTERIDSEFPGRRKDVLEDLPGLYEQWSPERSN